ncbi:hypothetical protein QQ008_01860 [Fulvivirgaceae bacterium BMA10]|uniref:Uncharacterized protein n=1 Tax=Splendidivirga corallicola TaxID=3051826 RepID=A0ABT8KH84_9BACT|nr:hypothetical protein [Fulvivirgaceae bacterium BMA10]
MKKKLGIIIGFMLLLDVMAFAQQTQNFTNFHFSGSVARLINPDQGEIEGSPYLTKDFMMGQIELENGEIYDDVMLRYNLYADQVEVTKEEKVYSFVPEMLRKFRFQHDKEYLEFQNGFEGVGEEGFSTKDYFLVLYKGNSALLKRMESVVKESESREYGSSKKGKWFSLSERYYIQKDQTFFEIKKTKKSLRSFFSTDDKEISAYIKKAQIKTDKDFANVIKYLDARQE